MDMESRTASPTDTTSEERLIPVIRARLAKKLLQEGLRLGEIAQALRVTQPAVTQYLKGRRGLAVRAPGNIDGLLDPLVEKLVKRVRSGLGVETAELLETAREIIIIMSGGKMVSQGGTGKPRQSKSFGLLRGRLQLELSAAEKYLELVSRTTDDYTKLLLRLIASDSLRHADIVSQIMSWLESGNRVGGTIPDETLLRSMLSIEDSASETNLTKVVEVDHPVARLLLRWIDIDENKHEKMVSGLATLDKRRKITAPGVADDWISDTQDAS